MSRAISVSVLSLLLASCSKDEPVVSLETVASASAVASAGAGAVASAGAANAQDSGGSVDHPLKAWMKANAAAAVNAHDFEGLAIALEKIAGFGPPGYPFWTSIARDGADAARAQDIDAVRGSCRGCHSQYRDRYKRELRDRPIGT
jgi:hypothetical protein